jgi:hypothetical protein
MIYLIIIGVVIFLIQAVLGDPVGVLCIVGMIVAGALALLGTLFGLGVLLVAALFILKVVTAIGIIYIAIRLLLLLFSYNK